MANDKKRAASPSKDDATSKKSKLMGGLDIDAVMSAEGPVCKAVLLKQDGSTTELDVDFTPSKQVVAELLGGDQTFLGQYEDIKVMLVINPEHQDDNSGVKLTKHKLQPPFHAKYGKVRGDILLFRIDDSGDHKDFTAAEYEAFLKEDIPEWEPESAVEDSDEDEEDEEGYRKAAVDFFIEQFKEENGGRDPTADELAEIEQRVAAEMEGPDAAQAALDYLVGKFEEEHGRKPTDEETEEMEKQVEAKLAELEGIDDDEDSELNDIIQKMFEEAVQQYMAKHGKEPDEEAKEIIAKAVADAVNEKYGNAEDATEDDEEDEEDEEADEADEGDEEEAAE